MMNIFKPSTPIATQLQTMVQFANCTTSGGISRVWPSVQVQVLAPNSLKIQWSHDHPMAYARPENIGVFKGAVISDVRSKLDDGVTKLFRSTPNVRRLERAGFADPEVISKLAMEAMESRVISSTPGALMLKSAAQMLGGEGTSPLPRSSIIFEMAAITFVTVFGEYVIYSADGLGALTPARLPMMAAMTVACAFYLARRGIDVFKSR